MSNLQRTAATVQGFYYLATGVWPLVHMRSFEAITGPKADRWLVRTVGVLITAIGAVLLGESSLAETPSGTESAPPSRTAALLAGWTAIGLAAIEIVEVARRRIRPVYLLDAFAELAFAASIGLGLSAGRPRRADTQR